MRHAKSATGDSGAPDIERPLTIRGRRAASLVGEHLVHHQMAPDRILCSTSKRTRETLCAMLPHLGNDCEIRIASALYEPGAGNYADAIGRLGESAQTLLVIGHNPTMQETAAFLIGSGNDALRQEVVTRFPTAGLAVIDFEGARWQQIGRGTCRIVAFFRPKDLELVGGDLNGDDEA
jgi:phosphohistidine phosphatase